jgi:hypothetical protein
MGRARPRAARPHDDKRGKGRDSGSIVCVDSTTGLAARRGRKGHSHSDSCATGHENECGEDQGEKIVHDRPPRAIGPAKFEATMPPPINPRAVARSGFSHVSDGAAGQSLPSARQAEPPRRLRGSKIHAAEPHRCARPTASIYARVNAQARQAGHDHTLRLHLANRTRRRQRLPAQKSERSSPRRCLAYDLRKIP